jgi:hypothetical protein
MLGDYTVHTYSIIIGRMLYGEGTCYIYDDETIVIMLYNERTMLYR